MVEVPDDAGSFFCVDSTEVTNLQYADFLATSPSTAGQPAHCSWNTDFTPDSGWPATAGDEPVAYVDWCDARAYCEAAGKHLCGSRTGATLTEVAATSSDSQWYYACSNGGSQAEPYGDASDADRCPPIEAGGGTSEAVHARACCAGPEAGLFGLMTNAVEWIDACTGTAGGSDTCRAMGAFDDGDGFECSDAAVSLARDATQGHLGFRCCAN